MCYIDPNSCPKILNQRIKEPIAEILLDSNDLTLEEHEQLTILSDKSKKGKKLLIIELVKTFLFLFR
jgi:hypothetical protein